MASKQVTPKEMRELAALHVAKSNYARARAQRCSPFERIAHLEASVDSRVVAYALLALAEHGHPITIKS